MLPRFKESDILYVRSMRASKKAVLNVQCRSIVVAGLVKSTFATLVKQTVKPDYIGNVCIFLTCSSFLKLLLSNSGMYFETFHYYRILLSDFDLVQSYYRDQGEALAATFSLKETEGQESKRCLLCFKLYSSSNVTGRWW